MAVLAENVRTARAALARMVPALGAHGTGDCSCKHALDGAVLNSLDSVPEQTLTELGPLIERLRRSRR